MCKTWTADFFMCVFAAQIQIQMHKLCNVNKMCFFFGVKCLFKLNRRDNH